jgi:response regulator NasT
MTSDIARGLRVLIADGHREDLEGLARLVADLGHEVVAREAEITAVGAATARVLPDVALVELGRSSQHALDLIGQIVHEAECPVIALLSEAEPAFVHEAARRGVFAYIVDTQPEALQSSIDLTLQRFAEFRDLRGAFGRRAIIEQAKGILMERKTIDADAAFALLRDRSQQSGRRVVDLAEAVVASHGLLTGPAPGA